jgi:hypothetical protein
MGMRFSLAASLSLQLVASGALVACLRKTRLTSKYPHWFPSRIHDECCGRKVGRTRPDGLEIRRTLSSSERVTMGNNDKRTTTAQSGVDGPNSLSASHTSSAHGKPLSLGAQFFWSIDQQCSDDPGECGAIRPDALLMPVLVCSTRRSKATREFLLV